MSQDFSKGKIYKITNDYNDEVYVGSTCNTLVKRFNQHKSHSKEEIRIQYPLYKLMAEIGFDRFRIELIEAYPCDDKYQLRQREGKYIREISTSNQFIAGRTGKEYREDNKNKIIERVKFYNQQNREKIAEYQKIYQEQKQDKIKEIKRKSHDKNIDKTNEKNREKITCECGIILSLGCMHHHKKTQKHIKLIEQKQN